MNIMNNKKRNYEILQNKNEFIKYNNKIIKDIKEIINNKNNKIENIINIYNKINKNNIYIISEIEIKKEDINKDIRIINTYEQYKREIKSEIKENEYKYKNEKK